MTVRDSEGRIKRRHKDDVKQYHEPQGLPWEEDHDGNVQEAEEQVREAEDVDHGQQVEVTDGEPEADGEADTAPAGEYEVPPIPAARPLRQKNLPSHLRDFVLKRVLKGKGGQ